MKIRKHHVENYRDFLKKTTKKYKFLDSGGYSEIFENKDNCSVIKITNDDAYLIYLNEAVFKYKNVHFPKIYEVVEIYIENSVVSTFIVMEKLFAYNKNLKTNLSTDKILKITKMDEERSCHFITHKNYPNSFNNFIKIMRRLERANKKLINDLSIADKLNIMFRKNGDLVVTDPFCGLLD